MSVGELHDRILVYRLHGEIVTAMMRVEVCLDRGGVMEQGY